MRLFPTVTAALRLLVRWSTQWRPADVVIEVNENGVQVAYLLRWFLIPRNRLFNVYAHFFARSDDDRALHDHPWWNMSILLKGSYEEVTFRDPVLRHQGGYYLHQRVAGDVVTRAARDCHRIQLREGGCWSLFITGPRIRVWGFRLKDDTWLDHVAYHERFGSAGEVQ